MHAVGLGALRTGTAPDGRCSDPDARKNKGERWGGGAASWTTRRMPRGLQSLDVPPRPYPSVRVAFVRSAAAVGRATARES